jgi:hypothetical protein
LNHVDAQKLQRTLHAVLSELGRESEILAIYKQELLCHS